MKKLKVKNEPRNKREVVRARLSGSDRKHNDRSDIDQQFVKSDN